MGKIFKLPKLFRDIYQIRFHLCCGFRRDFASRTVEPLTGPRTGNLLVTIFGVFHHGQALLERLAIHFHYKFIQARHGHRQNGLVNILEFAQTIYDCLKVFGIMVFGINGFIQLF